MWTCVRGVCSWVAGADGVPDLSCAADVLGSPCNRLSASGSALALAAALLYGSFAAFAKTRGVQQARVCVKKRECIDIICTALMMG